MLSIYSSVFYTILKRNFAWNCGNWDHTKSSTSEKWKFVISAQKDPQSGQSLLTQNYVLLSVSNDALEQMRARAIDTRTMMTLAPEEVEHLILNNLVQPGDFLTFMS